MIKINFDKYGKIRNLDFGDEVIFKGNNRVNQIFVAFDDVSYNPNHYMTYSALINENDYEGDLTDLATAKTTIDGVEGYTFYLFSNLTAKAGELKLSVRLVDRTTERVLVSGIIPLVIEDTAISTYASVDITKTQYNALLTAFDELSQSIDATNFKTINGESIYGEGDIVVLTGDVMVDYVGQEISNVNDSLWNLSQRISDVENENAELYKTIEKQEKKIEQLELASEGNILSTITENDSAYQVDVGVDTLPYATIDKIGGMTYKSDNILKINDIAETTKNGITYSVKNGIITINGTHSASSTTWLEIPLNMKLNGTYSINWFQSGTSSNIIYYRFQNASGTRFLGYQETKVNVSINDTMKIISLPISANTTITNYELKPMLVKGSTAPTTYQPYFEGLRDSKVTEIISAGANLQKEKWTGINSTITLSTPLKANEKYTMCIYVTTNVADGKGINVFDEKDNQLFSNSLASWGQPNDGWNSFVITPTIDTKTLRINAYGIVSKEMEGAILKGSLVTEKKYNSINLFKPYKQPTAIAIPTAIQNLDGYGLGVDATCYNYVDFESKKFVKMIGSYTFTGSEGFGQANTNTSGVYRYFTEVLKNIAVGVKASNVKGALLMADVNTTTADESYLKNDGVCIDSNGRLYFFNSDIQSTTDMANYLKGKTVYFALATPVAEDLSHIIDDEILTEVESGGTLTFENEYKQDVPFTWTFQEKL